MGQVTVRARGGDLFFFPAIKPGYEISGAAFFMQPHSRGRVRLTSPDPRAPLAIEHGFLCDERDVQPLVGGVELVRAVVAREPASRYAARELRPGADVDAETHVRASARGFFHPTGPCAIGSVVDRRGRLLGVDGIVVADASIIPRTPRANTNLTVVAVAERVAELLS